jgi:hypothetical protein
VKYQPTTRDRNGDGFVNGLDVAEFEFFFDPQSSPVDVYLNVGSGIRPNGLRVLRVSYELAQQVGPIAQIWREVYIVPEGRNQFQLNQPALRILQIVEEFPLVPDNDPQQFPAANDLDNEFIAVGSSLHFASPTPPLKFITRVLGIPLTQDRLGPLRADYLIEDLDGDGRFAEDPIDGQDNDGDGRIDEDAGGHWIVETGTTFDPDPSLRQKLNIPLQGQATVGIFQTTFGGITVDPNTNRPIITAITLSPNRFGLPLFPAPVAPNPSPNGNSLPQEGLLVLGFDPSNTLPVPPNERVRVAYRAGDDPNTPVDESWFLQVIKPPDDFQLAPNNADPDDLQAPSPLPFERLRWFKWESQSRLLKFSVLLAGLNVSVKFQVQWRNNEQQTYEKTLPISGNGTISFNDLLKGVPNPDDINSVTLLEVRGASLLVRVSGGSMWRQSPPKTRADYVELATIVPPPAKLTQP